MKHQAADVAMVTPLGRGQDAAVMFAERQQRLPVAQSFQLGQAQRFAGAFVLTRSIFQLAVAERLGLVIIVRGDESQRVGEQVLARVEAGQQRTQIIHKVFLD
jgi:hypothetical protein